MDAAREKQEGIQGQWQHESPFREVFEQVKRNADTDCYAQIMRRACNAKESGNWERFKEEFRNEGKLCEWTFERLHEAYDKVAMEDIGHFECSAGNSKTEHRLLEKDHRADVGCGRRDLVLCLPALQLLPYVCPHLVGIKRRRQQ